MTESLIPNGKRATDLKVIELAYISRKLKVDVLTAIGTKGHPDKQMALAWVACVWARRSEPLAPIERFTDMELAELYGCLGMGSTPQADAEELEDPDAEMRELLGGDDEAETMEEEIEANPMESVRG